jgi:WD40 repeat protein
VWSVAFSPDGSSLATGSSDSVVRVWNSRTGDLRRAFPDKERGDSAHRGFVYGVAFAPDKTTLASASEDGTVILWNLKTGRAHARLRGSGQFWSVAFAPANQKPGKKLSPLLVAGGHDGTIYFWRAVTTEPPRAPN